MSKKRTNFVDAHCHLSQKYYKISELENIIKKASENNIEFLIVNGGHEQENHEVIELAKKHSHLKAVIGIHPEDGKDENDVKRFESLIDQNVIGIGELGIDYYYEDAPTRENQIKSMNGQLKLAAKLNLPVVIHIRDKENSEQAFEDVYELVKKYKNLKFMLHTYAGNIEWAKKFMQFNCYFSFSGTVTFGSSDVTREVIKFLPLDRILTETDSPYLRVHPYTGLINEPNTVIFVSYYIAGLKGVGMDKFVSAINKNLRTLFDLK
ncbi:TatD family hydrolase [Mycoplasmopsis alligatoris]|uniref:Hydrolase, TatD family n=1 Tax=Mycoplasmopsis alligatoris A21JP2 TaxID=747682 RepID=D4XWG8_9BACT|nr:TatD family hydrolase [Mycoplasmopsis alligatoris]EFF41167.1 hydrolase, TatD family [Mycoplasmopsis alligatoris A21JP2]